MKLVQSFHSGPTSLVFLPVLFISIYFGPRQCDARTRRRKRGTYSVSCALLSLRTGSDRTDAGCRGDVRFTAPLRMSRRLERLPPPPPVNLWLLIISDRESAEPMQVTQLRGSKQRKQAVPTRHVLLYKQDSDRRWQTSYIQPIIRMYTFY